jgi:hypothetical protein
MRLLLFSDGQCLSDFWICLQHSAMLVTMLAVTVQKGFFWAINPLSGNEMSVLNITPYASFLPFFLPFYSLSPVSRRRSPGIYTLELWTFALQVAFLVADSFFAHWEAQPDRLEKTIHHCTTIFLVMTGLAVKFHHSGMVVMLIHKVEGHDLIRLFFCVCDDEKSLYLKDCLLALHSWLLLCRSFSYLTRRSRSLCCSLARLPSR